MPNVKAQIPNEIQSSNDKKLMKNGMMSIGMLG
jgi:hypothetical protein